MYLLGCKQAVYEKLKNSKETRDCDLVLFSELVLEQLGDKAKSMSLEDFFCILRRGDVFHFESISRVRRKLQELKPSLRGELWEARHREQFHVIEQLDMFGEI